MKTTTHSVKRSRTFAALVATGALVATTFGVGGAMAAPAQSAAPLDLQVNTSTGTINGYRNIGYFPQWSVYGRGFSVKKLQDSGTAKHLTHIQYAFGNIHHIDGTCFIANKAQGSGPNGSDGAGDAYADYEMGYTAATSVDGQADPWDQKLRGSFNQLKKLKALNPGLKVNISLGGWTWSKNFSKVAATDASRKKFVKSCVDLYLRGDLPVTQEGFGGPGTGYGVFDGIDIDWEWPGSLNGEVGNHVDTVNDKRNFQLLLKEFREQMDAYGNQVNRKFELTGFLPANPGDIASGGWNDPATYQYFDFASLQGYDFHGGWNPSMTGHQGNLYDDPADPRPAAQKYSIDKSLKAYTNAGIPAHKITLGMANYGRGWQGVNSNNAWSPASGTAPGTYESGIEDYDKLKLRGTDHFDANVGAAWRRDGNQWWSYDNVSSITQKSNFVASKGLSGAMWWDLSGNHDGQLIKTASARFVASPKGPVGNPNPTTPPPTTTPPTTTPPTTNPPTTNPPTTNPPTTNPPTTNPPGNCPAAWNSGAVYTNGDRVSHNGQVYKAYWWTQGETPGTTGEWGVWRLDGNCGGTTNPPTTNPPTTNPPTTNPPTTNPPTTNPPGNCPAAWSSSAVYWKGDVVSYNGVKYQAQWWTQGEAPSNQPWTVWVSQGNC